LAWALRMVGGRSASVAGHFFTVTDRTESNSKGGSNKQARQEKRSRRTYAGEGREANLTSRDRHFNGGGR